MCEQVFPVIPVSALNELHPSVAFKLIVDLNFINLVGEGVVPRQSEEHLLNRTCAEKSSRSLLMTIPVTQSCL